MLVKVSTTLSGPTSVGLYWSAIEADIKSPEHIRKRLWKAYSPPPTKAEKTHLFPLSSCHAAANRRSNQHTSLPRGTPEAPRALPASVNTALQFSTSLRPSNSLYVPTSRLGAKAAAAAAARPSAPGRRILTRGKCDNQVLRSNLHTAI